MSAPVLRLRDVHAAYGRTEVLHGTSLDVAAGEWFCILGPNGAGKSTLLACVGSHVTPSRGEIEIDGRSLLATPLSAKRSLGYAPAPDRLPDLLTGRQCLEIYAAAKALPSIDAEALDLAKALRFDGFMDRCVDTYSLGARQKLCILLALLGAPRLIVLDEAFNGLDPASALALKRHLRQRLSSGRCALLLATHSLDIVEHYADRAALLLDGRIAREWDRGALDALRSGGPTALEEELARTAP